MAELNPAVTKPFTRTLRGSFLIFAGFAVAWCDFAGNCSVGFCGEPIALLQLQIGEQRLEGRVAAHNDQKCWLLSRDGRMAVVPTDDVSDFRELEPRFRPYSALDLRDRLQSEFGRGYEVKTSSHYVVAAPSGAVTRYASLMEAVYRQFHTYFTTRGFRISEPEFPLIAVVLPDEESFIKYCVAEGAAPKPGLRGFYMPGSNRVALFEVAGQSRADDVDDTVIHEATHQVAFNTGVHSRIGPSPLWLVEGLATLFEADGIRKRETGREIGDRINMSRLEWFQEFRRNRRLSKSLESFVRDDGAFKSAPLDAYSQAWALAFYLSESRPVEFAKYLKTVATRDPLKPYDGDSRVKDFRECVSRDLEFLETGMLRFFDRLAE